MYRTKHRNGICRITLLSNVSLASKSWSNPPRKFADDLRSWVRTLVVAKRQFSDPVIFDKLGCLMLFSQSLWHLWRVDPPPGTQAGSLVPLRGRSC
jgi:hypothetical protein